MHDLVIRGGRVVDGTGAPERTADIAVDDGLIVSADGRAGPARREIDADGALVTPGWVDIHTHYDGQATWDPYLTPSSWHGVTTAVFGNCGVGFAPVRAGSERYLINLMEGVEDIPESVLSEGIDFSWENFAEYLDLLDSTPRIMDIGAQVPHAALRFFAMGARGADHESLPTEDEIAAMGRELKDALAAGALGFTTSRTIKHRAADGRLTPSLSAREPELAGLARAMRRAGRGVIEVNSDFGPGEFEIMREVAELAGRPLSVLLVQVDKHPDLWAETLAQVGEAAAAGLDCTAQVGSRPIGILIGLEASIHPFLTHPAWTALSDLSHAARIARIENDPALRRALVAERPKDGHGRWMDAVLERTFALVDPVDYEPDPGDAIAARARAAGRDPVDLALEMMLANGGRTLLLHPFENYFEGNLNVVQRMLEDPNAVCGVADAGAHVGLICDASAPTSLLTHWGRDRTRGPRLPLPFLVHKQTRATARVYGLGDRGALLAGLRADLNVIDFDALALRLPEVVHDLPAGGRRLIQRADGYRHTFVAGQEVMADGVFTGTLPGRLIRGARAAPAGLDLPGALSA